MTPGPISRRILADRLAIVERLLGHIRRLPLSDRQVFQADYRNTATAESCLRRILEALLDVGRHILAKGFGSGVSEYREIAEELGRHGVLEAEEVELLRLMAGYRNRLVHVYHEVAEDEVFELCSERLGDLERIAAAYRRWSAQHPEMLDERL